MNTTAIRNQLHEYIEHADDKHLAAIYVLLENEIKPSVRYDADTLEMLYRRVENDAKGNAQSYDVDSVMDYIRSQKSQE